jgi:hypothetical protein
MRVGHVGFMHARPLLALFAFKLFIQIYICFFFILVILFITFFLYFHLIIYYREL